MLDSRAHRFAGVNLGHFDSSTVSAVENALIDFFTEIQKNFKRRIFGLHTLVPIGKIVKNICRRAGRRMGAKLVDAVSILVVGGCRRFAVR